MGVAPKRFRFENAWLTEPMCEVLTRDSWGCNEQDDIQHKVQRCGNQLMVRGAEITGNFSARIKACRRDLKLLRGQRKRQAQKKYNEVRQNMFLILNQREIFWRQRSKQLWLHSGDQNNRYFHNSASTKRRNNQIQRFKNNDNHWVDWNTGLANLMSYYFTELFTASHSEWSQVVQRVPTTIMENQNAELLLPITEEEVKGALFQMHPDNSPGPDGMTPAFFQKHWNIIGGDIVQMVRKFFREGVLPNGLNATNIILIPKKKCPTKMTELRPISLCNVLIKIITKVLANRMKNMLNLVVSENQSAFIPGRLIADNVMISYEVMHYLKRKRRGKKGYMALKLDMSKAYDRIEWDFLRIMMIKMGFDGW